MTTSSVKGAEAVVNALISEGVKTIFALPGHQLMRLFDALYDHPELRVVITRHEPSVSGMANGYARATGEVGVGIVVSGPGALLASGGISTAYSTSSPVLLISGQVTSTRMGQGWGEAHEIEGQLEIYSKITKWSGIAMKVEDTTKVMKEAFRALKSGRPRPVETEFPLDVLGASGEIELYKAEVYPRAVPDISLLDKAVGALIASKKPIIWAGGGSVSSDAGPELLAIAEHLQAPVMTTENGKGIIPEDHYLAMGIHYQNFSSVEPLHKEADLILAVGTRATFGIMSGLEIEPNQKLIHIDVDSKELGAHWPTELGIMGDAKLALVEILRLLKVRSSPRGSRRDELEHLKRESYERLKKAAPKMVGFLEDIRSVTRRDAIFIRGVTQTGLLMGPAFPVYYPRTIIGTGYSAALGFEFPTAIGAKIGRPDRQVICVCGDGGFMYSCGDLSTAVKEKANVVTIVFNNSFYGTNRVMQKHVFEGRYIGTEFHNPDFVKFAESFGAKGIRANPEDLRPALKEALASDGPTLVEVKVPLFDPPNVRFRGI